MCLNVNGEIESMVTLKNGSSSVPAAWCVPGDRSRANFTSASLHQFLEPESMKSVRLHG